MENTATPKSEKKKSKKKWIIIGIVILLLAVIGSSGSDEASTTTVDQNSASSDIIDSTEKKTTEESTTANQTDSIKVGTTISNKQLNITYKSCDNDFQDYSYYADVKSGYKVVKAVFDFENISSTDVYVDSLDCYADGVKCESFYYVDDYSSPLFTSISSGRKLTDATVYFEVPVDAEKIELEYNAGIWTNEKYIFIIE